MKPTSRQSTPKASSATRRKASRRTPPRPSRLSGPDATTLHRKHGTQPATDKEFEEHFGDLPRDGEG